MSWVVALLLGVTLGLIMGVGLSLLIAAARRGSEYTGGYQAGYEAARRDMSSQRYLSVDRRQGKRRKVLLPHYPHDRRRGREPKPEELSCDGCKGVLFLLRVG